MPLEVVARPFRKRRRDLGGRERLVAELRAEARTVLVIPGERRVLVPHVPIVHVAFGVVLPCVAEVARPAAWRRRPVGARGVVSRDKLSLSLRARYPGGLVKVRVFARLLEPPYRAEAFIVTAPKRYRGVVAQAAQLVGKLALDLAEKRVVGRIHRARVHHIVPHEKAQLVAEIVKDILLVLSATPYADHVHVSRLRAFEEVSVARRRLTRFERVARNPVRALHEKAPVVDAKDERKLLLAVGRDSALVQDLQLSEADAPRDLLAVDVHGEGVKVLPARAVRPPEWRIVDLDAVCHRRAVRKVGEDIERAVAEVVGELLRRVDVIYERPVGCKKLHRAAEAN